MAIRKKYSPTSSAATGVSTAPPVMPALAYATAAVAPKPGPKPSGLAKPTSLYFINPIVDYGIIGGLSILMYLTLKILVSYGALQNERIAVGITVASMLAWVCNWPHFSATNYRLYHSTDNIVQYPLTALVVPWFILAAMIGAIMSPMVIAPYFVKLFFWWSSYHFCGQSFGITMIYAHRAGFPIGRWERLGLSTFIYGSFLIAASGGEVIADSTSGIRDFYGIAYQSIGLPSWLPDVFQGIMWAGGALFLVFACKWCIAKRRFLPPIILVPAAAQYVWFVLGSRLQSFNEFVPFFHCIQYLLIAWSMQLKEKMDVKAIAPSTKYVVGESLRWGLVNVAGGAALFVAFPLLTWAIVQRVSPSDFLTAARDIFVHSGAATQTPTLPFYIGVTIVGVQIHHFFVDGVIWKLKRKSVSSPLMVNLSDMLEPTQAS